MVYQNKSAITFIAGLLTAFLILPVLAQDGDAEDVPSGSDYFIEGEIPLYIIESWSNRAHDSLEALIFRLSRFSGDRGFGPAVGFLDDWRSRYYQSALLWYRDLNGTGDGSPVPQRAVFIRDAIQALQLLSDAEWDDELFAELAPLLADAMGILRPDITPGFRYWHSFFHGPAGEAFTAGDFFRLATSPNPQLLSEYLRDAGYSPAFALALQPGSARSSGFRPLLTDSQREIYLAGDEAARLLSDDAALSYNRLIRLRFVSSLEDRNDGRWPSYLEDLRLIEGELRRNLPASLSGSQLYESLFPSEGEFSDAYWSVLGLLENPFFLRDGDSSAQIELIYLTLLDELERNHDGRLSIYSSLHRSRIESASFSRLPQGRVRRYSVVVFDGDDEKAGDIPGEWSRLTRGIELSQGDDLWHIQTGIFPVERERLPADWENFPAGQRELAVLLEAAGNLEFIASNLQTTDPAVPYLIALRRLMLFDDIDAMLTDSDLVSFLPIESKVWINLSRELLNRSLAADAVNIPLGWELLGKELDNSEASSEILELLSNILPVVNTETNDNGAGGAE